MYDAESASSPSHFWTALVDWTSKFPDDTTCNTEGTTSVVAALGDAVASSTGFQTGALRAVSTLDGCHGLNGDLQHAVEITKATGGDSAFCLFYGAQTYELDLVYSDGGDQAETDSGQICTEMSLAGHWGGTFCYGSSTPADGLVSLKVAAHEVDGQIAGDGLDANGKFRVAGTIRGQDILFSKEYEMSIQGEKRTWLCKGRANDKLDTIQGTWKPSATAGDSDALLRFKDEEDGNRNNHAVRKSSRDTSSASSQGGLFELKRRPMSYFISRPSSEELSSNRPRALWNWALHSVLRVVKSRHLQWRTISDHRDRRLRYIDLYFCLENYGIHWTGGDEETEWINFIKTVHPEDLLHWRSRVIFKWRREIIHS